MKRRLLLLGTAPQPRYASALPATAQTKWDLPAGYPAGNPHTQNLTQFAADVDKATGGKLDDHRASRWRRCSRRQRSSARCRAARRRSAKC